MSVVISDEVLRSLQMSEAELRQEIAILFFQQKRFTLGQASRFAGLNQLAFQHLLADCKISLHYGIVELQDDVKSLEANNWQ